MTTGEAIAQRIDFYLQERNMSLYRLAKDACLPIATLQNLYRGHTKSPTVAVVFKVIATLHVSIDEFFDCPLFDLDQLELY